MYPVSELATSSVEAMKKCDEALNASLLHRISFQLAINASSDPF
jgi:hypothetical protein